jgi:hypothetical protein
MAQPLSRISTSMVVLKAIIEVPSLGGLIIINGKIIVDIQLIINRKSVQDTYSLKESLKAKPVTLITYEIRRCPATVGLVSKLLGLIVI